MDNRPRRILVYRIGQIGDTVVALPALWAIRQHFPAAHITLLGNQQPGSSQVLAGKILPNSGLINDTLTYTSDEQRTRPLELLRLLRKLRRFRYDTLAYLAPRLRTNAAVARDLVYFRLAGIRHFLGHKDFGLPLRIPEHPLPRTDHEADHLLKRLASTGIQTPMDGEGEMNLAISQVERTTASRWLQARIGGCFSKTNLVGLAPGSNWPSKVWPESRFMELGRRLIDDLDLYPIVFGGAEDAELGDRLIEHWGTGTNAAGCLDVRLAAAAFGFCSFYVGNDTGAMHLAAAVGTPCVVVMSAQDWPGRWNPYGRGHMVLRKTVACEGCLLRVCKHEGLRCLIAIDVDEVMHACKKALASGRFLRKSNLPDAVCEQ